MEIIDAHAHIYPEKIAEKATVTIGKFYDIEMAISAGTAEKLVEQGKKAGITRFLVHSVATTTHQVRSINEFILRESKIHSEFIPFMTLHQDMSEEEMVNEVAWCAENGFHGVKLHPDFQKFNIDDIDVYKIYRAVSSVAKHFPIMLHMGDDRYEYSKPKRLAKVAKDFPELNFIAAHFGGYRCWQEVGVYNGLENIYFDTSSSLDFIDTKEARKLIDQFGAEKFFFGTDYPMWNAKEELERFNKIPMTDIERENILSKNIKKILNI